MGDPTHQVHDWEPGIADNGLFWTIPIDASLITADAATGVARFHGQAVRVTDFHDFFNAVLGGGPTPVPAHVSFDVRWAGNGDHVHVHDTTFGFTGDYVQGPATIEFTAWNEHGDVIYRSDRAGQYNPTPQQGGAGTPAVGTEQNGVFFS